MKGRNEIYYTGHIFSSATCIIGIRAQQTWKNDNLKRLLQKSDLNKTQLWASFERAQWKFFWSLGTAQTRAYGSCSKNGLVLPCSFRTKKASEALIGSLYSNDWFMADGTFILALNYLAPSQPTFIHVFKSEEKNFIKSFEEKWGNCFVLKPLA